MAQRDDANHFPRLGPCISVLHTQYNCIIYTVSDLSTPEWNGVLWSAEKNRSYPHGRRAQHRRRLRVRNRS